jgi:large subunit ribosomal protein L25
MEEILLEAELREGIGKIQVNMLRHKGFIPAVIYGEGGKPQSIQLSQHRFVHLMHEKRIENAIITLTIKGAKSAKTHPCLIKEIQYEPVHGSIKHVDFHEISLTKEIKVNIPVVAKGEPMGVKLEGGSLEHVLWEVEVECLPTAIPKNIEVDVSAMKIGDAVHVKDLRVPAGVTLINDQSSIVLSVVAPMKEEAPAEEGAEDASKEPEVIKEKKEVPGEGAEEGKEGKEGKEAKEKK